VTAPLRVLLVGPLPPPSGGMANQTRQLARLLAGEGWTATVVQVNASYRPAWIARLRGVRALARLGPYAIDLWRSARDADLVHVMANSGWAWHLFASPAIVIARMCGKPVIVNYRGGEAEAFLQRQGRWVLPILRLATAVIVPSGYLQRVFARWGISAQIVPNIVDLQRFAPGAALSGPPHLIVTRNLEDIYDLPTALRAFARIRQTFPAARLTIAGSGPRHADLVALASTLGVASDTTFTGRVDNDQMPDLYRSADLLLNPSRVDNMPISLLEAMASGIPIVSTDVGGIAHLVTDGETALLVPPGDVEAMATAAIRILDDRGLASRLRNAGLEAARAYTWTRVRGQLFAVYSSGLAAVPPSRGGA
jgi:glycosyltransferase involved in cell wall biosynthesis